MATFFKVKSVAFRPINRKKCATKNSLIVVNVAGYGERRLYRTPNYDHYIKLDGKRYNVRMSVYNRLFEMAKWE